MDKQTIKKNILDLEHNTFLSKGIAFITIAIGLLLGCLIKIPEILFNPVETLTSIVPLSISVIFLLVGWNSFNKANIKKDKIKQLHFHI